MARYPSLTHFSRLNFGRSTSSSIYPRSEMSHPTPSLDIASTYGQSRFLRVEIWCKVLAGISAVLLIVLAAVVLQSHLQGIAEPSKSVLLDGENKKYTNATQKTHMLKNESRILLPKLTVHFSTEGPSHITTSEEPVVYSQNNSMENQALSLKLQSLTGGFNEEHTDNQGKVISLEKLNSTFETTGLPIHKDNDNDEEMQSLPFLKSFPVIDETETTTIFNTYSSAIVDSSTEQFSTEESSEFNKTYEKEQREIKTKTQKTEKTTTSDSNKLILSDDGQGVSLALLILNKVPMKDYSAIKLRDNINDLIYSVLENIGPEKSSKITLENYESSEEGDVENKMQEAESKRSDVQLTDEDQEIKLDNDTLLSEEDKFNSTVSNENGLENQNITVSAFKSEVQEFTTNKTIEKDIKEDEQLNRPIDEIANYLTGIKESLQVSNNLTYENLSIAKLFPISSEKDDFSSKESSFPREEEQTKNQKVFIEEIEDHLPFTISEDYQRDISTERSEYYFDDYSTEYEELIFDGQNEPAMADVYEFQPNVQPIILSEVDAANYEIKKLKDIYSENQVKTNGNSMNLNYPVHTTEYIDKVDYIAQDNEKAIEYSGLHHTGANNPSLQKDKSDLDSTKKTASHQIKPSLKTNLQRNTAHYKRPYGIVVVPKKQSQYFTNLDFTTGQVNQGTTPETSLQPQQSYSFSTTPQHLVDDHYPTSFTIHSFPIGHQTIQFRPKIRLSR